jgi:hypothetical protein
MRGVLLSRRELHTLSRAARRNLQARALGSIGQEPRSFMISLVQRMLCVSLVAALVLPVAWAGAGTIYYLHGASADTTPGATPAGGGLVVESGDGPVVTTLVTEAATPLTPGVVHLRLASREATFTGRYETHVVLRDADTRQLLAEARAVAVRAGADTPGPHPAAQEGWTDFDLAPQVASIPAGKRLALEISLATLQGPATFLDARGAADGPFLAA